MILSVASSHMGIIYRSLDIFIRGRVGKSASVCNLKFKILKFFKVIHIFKFFNSDIIKKINLNKSITLIY